MIAQALDIKRITVFALVILFFIADRLLKLYVFKIEGSYNLIGKLLAYKFSKNQYIALSLPFPDGVFIRSLIALIIAGILALAYYFVKKNNSLGLSGCMFLVCGAASNLFDRLAYGYVIDYISVEYFSVFNLADVSVVLGAVLLAWSLWQERGTR